MVFPLELRFKLLVLAGRIAVTDATGRLLYYVRQKAFRLKEAVTVYADEAQQQPLYRIAADRVLDISAQYHIEDHAGTRLGVVQRRGMRSLWRAHYEIHRAGEPLMTIREANPWAKVLDGLVGELPIIGMFTGYFLHPSYVVTRVGDGATVLRVEKQPAFFEGRYRIEQITGLDAEVGQLAVLSILMMLLLERERG
jgi:hypothetical protein